MSDRFGEPAPLLAAPGAPVPPGAEAAWVQGAGGVRLRAALFQPAASLRGSVVVSPGRTEFVEKYFEVARELQDRGFVVLVHDWRGQGLSDRLHPDPLRGHAAGVDAFVEDFARVLAAFEARLPKPWINLAHSMGAGLTTVALARGESRFAGQLLSAPMFGVVARRVHPGVLDLACRLNLGTGGASRWAFRMEPGGGPRARLSHDARRMQRWLGQIRAHPQLALGGLTWGWLRMALDVRRELTDAALSRLALPTTLLLASEEDAVDNAAARRAARATPSAELVELPGAWHEILMETDDIRARAWAAFDALADRAAPRTSPATI